ncbi:hypothetical protein Cob_v001603 [Colletotrichum orbiculare MAFF 240422]|uniref:Uncharacterized protein n=1 Tax=Colletotrichum orbiculare (strain 104-T / ATCC 96160 / CBS 514.97 / LARS 414 / MAFF 240422) TaxID=1213857 RepID=N4V894_COLOR|nr:hypothetical protein Cob_v001603 [Colletotrichum orbiculare MAFF 240422]
MISNLVRYLVLSFALSSSVMAVPGNRDKCAFSPQKVVFCAYKVSLTGAFGYTKNCCGEGTLYDDDPVGPICCTTKPADFASCCSAGNTRNTYMVTINP